ncbi:MAG: hypothetical protein U1F53_08715 [Burkholderiaceae bacterium]
MIDHVGIGVGDYARSKAFYERALAAIGYTLLAEVPREFTGGVGVAGFGVAPKPDFWIHEGQANRPPNHDIEAVCHEPG